MVKKIENGDTIVYIGNYLEVLNPGGMPAPTTTPSRTPDDHTHPGDAIGISNADRDDDGQYDPGFTPSRMPTYTLTPTRTKTPTSTATSGPSPTLTASRTRTPTATKTPTRTYTKKPGPGLYPHRQANAQPHQHTPTTGPRCCCKIDIAP